MNVKKIIGFVLSITMILSTIPVNIVYADEYIGDIAGPTGTISSGSEADDWTSTPTEGQIYSCVSNSGYDLWSYSNGKWNYNYTTKEYQSDRNGMYNLLYTGKEALTNIGGNRISMEQSIPKEVVDFVNSEGGSWDNVKISFSLDDDRIKTADDIFEYGNVDYKIIYSNNGDGTGKIQYSFVPILNVVKQSSAYSANYAAPKILPQYGYVMYSVFDKNGKQTHRGALKHFMINGGSEDEYDPWDFSYISPVNGGKNGYFNKSMDITTLEKNHSTNLDTMQVGKDGTFKAGGAFGLHFNFKIRATFEINPVKEDDTKIISEAGYVNLQDVDNTIANLQLYSNRDDFIEILKSAKVDKMITKLNDDDTFRERVTQSLLSVEDRKKESSMEFARGVMKYVLTNNEITDAVVYKYYKSCTGSMDGLTDSEIENILTYGARVVLANSFQISVKDVYNDLVSNFTGKDIGNGDLIDKMGTSMKLQFNDFDTSILYNGNLKSFLDKSTDFKTVHNLPTLYYLFNDKEIQTGVLRQYSLATTRELAKRLNTMDENVYTFVKDNRVLSGATVDGELGYYQLNESYLLDLVRGIEGEISDYDVITVDSNRVKMKDTGVLYDENGGAKYLSNTEGELKHHNTNIYDAVPFTLVGFVDYNGMNFESTDKENVLKYNGVYSYSGLVSDLGCDVKMDVVKVNADKSMENVVNGMYVGTANRYEKFDAYKTFLTNGDKVVVNIGDTQYKPLLIAYSDKSDAETDSIVNKLIGNEGDLRPGIYQYEGIKVAVGDTGINDSSLYPTEGQLKNQSDIKIRTYIRDLKPVRMCVNYVDENNQLLENRIGNAPVEDGKVWACIDGTLTGTFDFICAYVSNNIPKRGLNADTTWTEISINCEPADGQWLTQPGFVNVDEGKEQIVYIKAMKKAVDNNVVGNFTLNQQRISKSFNTADVYDPALRTRGTVDTDKHTKRVKHSYWSNGRKRYYYTTYYCNINRTSSDTYNILFSEWSDANDKIAVGAYGTEVTNNSTGNKRLSITGTTNDRVSPNMKFVLWRGYDKPVAASYADTGYNGEVWDNFGIGSSNRYVDSGVYDSYNKNIKLYFNEDTDNSDKNVKFECSFGKTHSGVVNGDSKTKDTSLAVNVFTGWKGVQTAQSNGNTAWTMNGIGMTDVSKNTVRQNTIKFFPYVNMKFEDQWGNIKDLNVLSKYQSTITPVSTVEIGYRAGGNDSIGISSDNWSTHQRSINAHGRYSTIPGGATYQLSNNNPKLPAVGVKTYSMYVPNDATNAVYEGSWGNTQADAEKRHNDTAWALQQQINGVKVNQRLNVNGSVITPQKGGTAGWLNNQPFMTDDKYWFKNRDVSARTSNVTTNKDYYRISSDTQGNVMLDHGSNRDYTFNKWNTNEYILGQLNDEWRDVEAKTGLVSCYLNSIIRHEGNDSEFSDDGKWYSEAFPGLCVYVATTTFNVELNPEVCHLNNTVNMRYVGRTESKADIYKQFFQTWFSAEWANLTTNYGGSSVGMGWKDLNLRTKDWFIPNATVYDND